MFFHTNNLYKSAGTESSMIEHIISAYYFNPLPPTNSPYKEKSSACALRWCVSGSVDMISGGKRIHLCSSQIMISDADTDIQMIVGRDQKTVFAITTFVGDLSLLRSVSKDTSITLSGMEHELLFQYFYTASQHYSDSRSLSVSDATERYAICSLEAFLLRLELLNSEERGVIFSTSSKAETFFCDQKITIAIKQYLNSHLYQVISLEDISRETGISTNTAMHIFKKDVGMGIKAYFTKLKINEAMRLLAQGELSIRSVSERLGFESAEYFSRVFKRETGMTPTEYSKRQSMWSGCLASLFM